MSPFRFLLLCQILLVLGGIFVGQPGLDDIIVGCAFIFVGGTLSIILARRYL